MTADHVSLTVFLERVALMLGAIALGVAAIFVGFRLGAKRLGTTIERYNGAGFVFMSTLMFAAMLFGIVALLWPS